MNDQLLNFLERTKQMNPNLHAYRTDFNTTTALAQVSDTILEATDKNLITTIVTIDESAAFDCVCTDTLLQKLHIYNVDNHSLEWIRQYLTDRSHFVQIGAKKSQTTSVRHGVPQGSVLGPLLFSIYMNELPQVVSSQDCTADVHSDKTKLFSDNCLNCGSLPCYTDDANFIISKKTRRELQMKVDENITKLKNFLNNNDLTVNVGKHTHW